MYRYRKIDQLLGKHQELENQEIYFSDLDSLNDPLEGYKNMLWKGESLLWKNLLKHYILCLTHTYLNLKIYPDDYVFKSKDIPVFLSIELLDNQKLKSLIEEIYFLFFSKELVIEYIDFLKLKSNLSAIDQVELSVHLKRIHLIALKVIIEILVKHGYELNKELKVEASEEIIKEYLKNLKTNLKKHVKSIEKFFRIEINLLRQRDLTNAYNYSKQDSSLKKFFLLSSFSENYVTQLEKLVYPESYVACFIPTSDNPLIWSHYGDSHRGVCLKFKTKDENSKKSIELEDIISWGSSGNNKAFRTFHFQQIKYTNNYSNIYFFENIGSIPLPQIASQWHMDGDEISSFYSENLSSEDQIKKWRSNHWQQFTDLSLKKLKDWQIENESRLIINSAFNSYDDKNDRKLKYKFEALEGIIFGAKTTISDKIKIIKIIEEKCKKYDRKEFNFYQASLEPNTGKMNIEKLSLLKF